MKNDDYFSNQKTPGEKYFYTASEEIRIYDLEIYAFESRDELTLRQESEINQEGFTW